MTFASFGLPPVILKGIRAAGFTDPTAIQSKAIPVIMEGNDLIGAAQRGSGKTGAYVIPILARLIDNTTTRLRAVILAPTRELAQYIETRVRDYARYTELKVGVVFTGGPLPAQERQMREQPIDILVATPGRLLELQAKGAISFEDIEVMVLDEADQMVALGLATDIRKLLKLLPETRQTLMFAMTMPPELNRLTKEALIEPVRVDMAPSIKPSTGITQAIYPVPRDLKLDLLDEMLSRSEVRGTLLFCRHRSGADRVAKMLQRHGYSLAILDDQPSQDAREAALEDLKRGKNQLLLSSEAVARSLDVTGVAHVVNLDVPQTPEDYVHRLGRAGRQDPVGDIFTLMSPEEQRDVAAIERLLGRAIPRVWLPDFDYGMRPKEIHKLVSYGDEGVRRQGHRPVAGLQAAATKIAVTTRPTEPASKHSKPAAAPSRPAPKPAAAKSRPGGAKSRPAPARKTVAKRAAPKKPAKKHSARPR